MVYPMMNLRFILLTTLIFFIAKQLCFSFNTKYFSFRISNFHATNGKPMISNFHKLFSLYGRPRKSSENSADPMDPNSAESKKKKPKIVKSENSKKKSKVNPIEDLSDLSVQSLLGDSLNPLDMDSKFPSDWDMSSLDSLADVLGDVEFPAVTDELDLELDDALRSIESGKFDINDFLLPDDDLDFEDESESIDRQNSQSITSSLINKSIDNDKIQSLSSIESNQLSDDDEDIETDNEDAFLNQVTDDEELMFDVIEDVVTDFDKTDYDFDDSFDMEDIISNDSIPSNIEKSKQQKKKRSKNTQNSINVNEETVIDSKTSTEQNSDIRFDSDLIQSNSGTNGDKPLVIDGIELNREELKLGVDSPPLEEFRRLMESLGPDTMFEDERYFDETAARVGVSISRKGDVIVEDEEDDLEESFSDEEKLWHPTIYSGGNPERLHDTPLDDDVLSNLEWWSNDHDKPASWRVQIVSVVTNSTKNSSAIDIVNQVYDYIRNGTNNDPRIRYQTICYEKSDGQPFEELEDMIQMWLESYNTYHLVDGAAMKEAWGCIMPHIMLSEKNLKAILDQVLWALAEDKFDGALLTPRLRRVRFRGGAREMAFGFNTEHLDSEFSVVSVR